jgi:DNA-binding response OmpR family regulator
MIVILDEREGVGNAYVACLERVGVAAVAFDPVEFCNWLDAAGHADVQAVEACLLGHGRERQALPQRIKSRTTAPVIAVCDGRSLAETLELFEAGVDDAVAKPIHVREILARVRAICRRNTGEKNAIEVAGIRTYFDGRDPVVGGEVLLLPRRERRILEYLVSNCNVRVTKSQIFSRVYGVFNDNIDENVIESHISRLRKKLRSRLGADPIECQRYLGYRLVDEK